MIIYKTQKEAKEAGEKYFYPDKVCKNNHENKYATRTGTCYQCTQEASKANWWKKRNTLGGRQVQLYNGLKNRCKREGIEFNLTPEDIKWNTHCPVFGTKLSYLKADKDNSPSIDRTDPNKGYIKGNIVVMSMRANRGKWNLTLDEMKILCYYMEQLNEG